MNVRLPKLGLSHLSDPRAWIPEEGRAAEDIGVLFLDGR
jgi:hypothetical protein